MPSFISPNSRKVSARAWNNTDVILEEEANGTAVNSEDVVKVGKWEDYTGSGGETTNFNRGSNNKLQNTTAAYSNGRSYDRTSSGNPKPQYRTRTKLTYFDFSDN